MTDTTTLESAVNGRPMKFTRERFDQIRNLVERGLTREQIAETIGTTLGSLQVTCSKMGISLRRAPSALPARKRPSSGTTVTLEIAHNGGVKKIIIPISTADFVALVIEAEIEGKSLVKLIATKIKGQVV